MDHAANGSQPRADSLQIAFRDFSLTLRLPSEGILQPIMVTGAIWKGKRCRISLIKTRNGEGVNFKIIPDMICESRYFLNCFARQILHSASCFDTGQILSSRKERVWGGFYEYLAQNSSQWAILQCSWTWLPKWKSICLGRAPLQSQAV